MSELSKLGVDTRRALLEEAERELATRRMSAYHLRMNPGYTLPKHLKIIGDDIDDLFAGNPPHNRAYFVSPRSGKSEIMCSAAASEMGRTGGKGSVLWISRSQELSNIMSRTVRGQILDPLYPFEKVSISKSSSSVEHWELEGRGMGAFNALGVLAGTVGIGASLTIYDDICGGIEDFCDPSGQPDPNKMRAYEEWYTTKARTRQAGRLSGSGPALSILISTRWSNFDPASMIITKGDWKVLRIPQFCDDVDNDPLGRTTLGECQWPEMFSQADMEQTRLDVGERVWSAHYQGLPQMESGSIFKKEWFGDEQLFDVVPTVDSYIPGERNTWTGTPGSRILVQRRADRVIACDGSWGLNKNSDWSVIATIAVVPDELRGCLFYVESVQRMKVDHPTLTAAISAAYQTYMPSQGVVLEASQSLLAVLQSLRAVNRIPVRAIPPRTGKIQRALSWTALAESGRIYWKRGAEWLPYTLDEILSFPLGKHDDIVDALSLGFSSLWDALPVKALGVPRQSSLVTASQLQAAQRARRWA